MSIMYKPAEPLEVGIGESMPAEFIKEAERSRARIVSLTDEIKRLKTENARLRELVRLMWKPFCWAQSRYEVCLTDEQDTKIRDKVRELEVEVDE